MSEDIRHIEFLANKSKDFIDKQIGSYRQKQSNSGTIMAIISLFIPFFLGGLDEAFTSIKLIAILPIGLFVYGIFLFIEVLKSRSLDQGFHTDKFQDLANWNDYKKVLLYEIGANQSSFNDNKIIVDRANSSFERGIKVTLIAILISIALLLTNKFIKPTKLDVPHKNSNYQIKHKTMNDENEGADSSTSSSSSANDNANPATSNDIPYVPPSGRTNLNDQREHITKPFIPPIIKKNEE